jgi:hypothetical protein
VSFIINPGTGPVEGATLAHAEANVARLIEDTGRPFEFRHTGEEYDGRFTFELSLGDERREVDMPGLPLERVRFVNGAEQNIFDFPRLYVDGSSWVWCYGVGMLAEPPEGDAA